MFRCFSKSQFYLYSLKATQFKKSINNLCRIRFYPIGLNRDITTSNIASLNFDRLYRSLGNSDKDKFREIFGRGNPKKIVQTKSEVQRNLKKFVPWLTDKDIETITRLVDQEKYNSLEFLHLVVQIPRYKRIMDDAHAIVFKNYDTDNDGRLDEDELKMMIDTMHAIETPTQRGALLSRIMRHDSDQDDKITLDDYADYFWKDPESNPFSNFLNMDLLRVFYGIPDELRQDPEPWKKKPKTPNKGHHKH